MIRHGPFGGWTGHRMTGQEWRTTVGWTRLFAPFFAVTLSGCGIVSSTPSVESIEEANRVAHTIRWAATNSAPYTGQSQSWSDERIAGFEQGLAVVNGSFERTSGSTTTTRTYRNVTIEFSDFCNDCSVGPTITGTALLQGSTTTTARTSGNSYSGQWGLSGRVELSGEFGGTADFQIAILRAGGSWVGVLDVDGQQWDVQSPF